MADDLSKDEPNTFVRLRAERDDAVARVAELEAALAIAVVTLNGFGVNTTAEAVAAAAPSTPAPTEENTRG